MRILSLGYGLPDSQIDNYTWASALSFFDYDAIIVEPNEAVSKFIEGVTREGAAYHTYEETAITDGPTTSSGVGLIDLLRRRREEVERLLGRGGIVVIFAHPDVPHSGVPGFGGAHRYYWLPAPTGQDYGSTYLKPASGIQVKPIDYEHPFADFLERQRSHVQYRALFAEGAQGLTDARVLGRSNGGAAIAIEVPVGGGRVIFLPALPPQLSNSDRQAVATSLVAGIRNALLIGAEDEPPDWVDSMSLPGIEDAHKRFELAETQVEELETELDEARNAYLAIDRYRRILWQEGKYGFELPVRDVLGLLGFSTSSAVDEPAAFYVSGELVLVEAEGSIGPVGMEPHYRLRERLESKIAAESKRPRGIIVVNGFRHVMPEERPQQYEDSLRVAAESMRYCVVDALQLFEAVKQKLDGKDVKSFIQQMLETEGVLETKAGSAPKAD